jgi:hypothetical protein
MTEKPNDFDSADWIEKGRDRARRWLEEGHRRAAEAGVTLTSAKHPHSLLDPVEALFHQHGLDINEHAELIRAIEAYVDEVVRYSQ